MKKIICIAIIIIAAITAKWNSHENKTVLSNIALDNIEALANGEDDGVVGERKCYNTITTQDGSKIRYCQTCSWVDGTNSWGSSSGKC